MTELNNLLEGVASPISSVANIPNIPNVSELSEGSAVSNISEEAEPTAEALSQRQSFIFYASFKEAIDCLPPLDRLAIYDAICDYAISHKEPELEGVAKVAWLLIKPQLDANWRKYQNGCKGGAKRKLVGRSRKTPTGSEIDGANEKENEKVNLKDNQNNKEVETTTTIPYISEIIEYIGENRLAVDPNYFFDYYTSNGWMVGKNQIVDWKALLRNWDRINRTDSRKSHTTNTSSFITCDDL